MSGRAARRSVSHRLSDLRFALKNRAVLGLDATRDVRRAVRELRRFRTQFHGLGCGWFAESMREHDLSTARSEAMTPLYEDYIREDYWADDESTALEGERPRTT